MDMLRSNSVVPCDGVRNSARRLIEAVTTGGMGVVPSMPFVVVRVSMCDWGFQEASLKCVEERAIAAPAAEKVEFSTRYTSHVATKRAHVSCVTQFSPKHSCFETHSRSCETCGSHIETCDFTGSCPRTSNEIESPVSWPGARVSNEIRASRMTGSTDGEEKMGTASCTAPATDAANVSEGSLCRMPVTGRRICLGGMNTDTFFCASPRSCSTKSERIEG
mmetsp:Transcript_3998/g.9977  ORF Transcript_3998/g.9977 Transcript_3998/m.9977 type:complete len:220 (+) Transcript_3998:275-934(+)